MNNRSPVLLLVLCCMPVVHASPQPEALRHLAEHLQQATVQIAGSGDRASGVIVSKSGLILTVAHGLPRDADTAVLQVRTVEGQSRQAVVISVDQTADLALLQLKEPLPQKFSRLRMALAEAADKTSPLAPGTAVLASGFPGREGSGHGAVLRLGQVAGQDPQYLRSTCSLTAGDSGGPLMTLDGLLAGIHSRIGLSINSNHHIPIRRIADFLARSKLPEHLQNELLATTEEDARLSAAARNVETQLQRVSDPVQKEIAARLVSVEVGGDDGAAPPRKNSATDSAAPGNRPIVTQSPTWMPISQGTLLDAHHVATKLSSLRDEPLCRCVLPDQRTVVANLVHAHVGHDLAILRLRDPASEIPAGVLPMMPAVGDIVFAISSNGDMGTGIVARPRWDEPPQAGRLGVDIQTHAVPDRQVFVAERVSPNSTASRAGIEPGDRLLTLNAHPLRSLEQLGQLLQQYQPGDWMQFEVERDRQTLVCVAALGRDPGRELERSEYLDGRAGALSDRRTGFKDVIQHDIPLEPQQCGGPLVNQAGELIGINIARRAREASLALPLTQVQQALRAALTAGPP